MAAALAIPVAVCGQVPHRAAPIDAGLVSALNQQADALAGGDPRLLSDVAGLRRDVPPDVLNAAAKLLSPSRQYVVQNLSAGQGNPDAGAMSKLNTAVFISTSMPGASLQALFRQAAGRRDVGFVLRGWTPPHFRELIAKIKANMPKGQPEASVFIDPQAFEQYHVGSVPVTIHKRASDQHWYELTGEISVDGAVNEIEHDRAGRVVGNTYPIAEPDILEVIRQRLRQVDWKKQVANAKASASEAPFNGVDMPVATKTESHLFDPSIVLTRDVINPSNGQLLAARGTRVNPLQLQPFPYVVIAFNPYDAGQMKWATDVVKDHPNALVYVTRNAMHADGRPTWDVLGTRTFALDEKAAARFDIASVPTLVRQEGTSMLVSTFSRSSLSAGN